MPDEVTRADLVRRVPPEASRLVAVMSDDEIRRSFRIASAFAATATINKQAPTPEIAFAKMTVGRDLGMSPAVAIMSIDFVEGGIMIRGVRLLAWIRERPDYEYKIMHSDQEKATLRILGFPVDEQFEDAYRFRGQWWEVLGEETFTVQDAETAGKLKSTEPKAAWNAYRKNMLVWRAASNAVKFHAPDIFNGMPVYTEADFDVEGTAIDLGGDLEGGGVQGLDLGPKVEAILQRAAALGHVGIADRANAEVTLGQQDPGFVEAWCVNATKVLDGMAAAAAEGPPEAEIVEATAEDEAAAEAAVAEAEQIDEAAAELQSELALRERMGAELEAVEEEMANAAAEGDDARTAELLAQRDALRSEIESRWPDEGTQQSLGVL